MAYDENRREDPVIRALVAQKLDGETDALKAAEKALIEVRETIESAMSYELREELPLYDDACRSVFRALLDVRRALQGARTEIYIGNLAASTFGEIIEKEAAGKA